MCTRSPKQLRDRSSWSSLKKPGEIKERYCFPDTMQDYSYKIECILIYSCLLDLQQQLDQLQKELSFLEEDIKRVEVSENKVCTVNVLRCYSKPTFSLVSMGSCLSLQFEVTKQVILLCSPRKWVGFTLQWQRQSVQSRMLRHPRQHPGNTWCLHSNTLSLYRQ